MKKISIMLLTAGLTAGLSATAAPGGFSPLKESLSVKKLCKKEATTRIPAERPSLRMAKKLSKQQLRKGAAGKAEETASKWRSSSQRAYGWNGEEWELEESYSIIYDALGQKAEQTVEDMEGYLTREIYTWNENGQMASRVSSVADGEDEEFVETSRLFREYDSRLTDFITFNDQQVWDGAAWVPSNSYKQEIARDAAGNVTSMVRSVYFDGDYDPIFRLENQYGEDGKVSAILCYDLNYDYFSDEYVWEESSIEDIVWEETDGQIVDVEQLFSFQGPNRIKSAKVTFWDDIFDVNIEYTPDGFTGTSRYGEDTGYETLSTVVYRVLDGVTDPDSPHYTTGWQVLSTFTVIEEEEVVNEENTRETYIYDENELVLLEMAEIGFDGEWEIEAKVSGDVEYDEEHGYPLSWTVSEYDYDEEEMVKVFRAEYSDYADYGGSGISAVASGVNDAPVYYTLQGNRVANPAKGIYLRVNGAKVEKVVVR